VVALGLLAAGFWFLQAYGLSRPQIVAAHAPETEFSAERAEAVLARILGPERPHPVSTPENAAVRARILTELEGVGLHPIVRHGFGCKTIDSFGLVSCASVNNILAEVKPGAGRAIILMAHYDSVPAGPGAADDESGVATVIETARALRADPTASRHPIIALLTDGEEADLLGAAAFLHDPELKSRVGAVINVEARGNQGPSLLFQTSAGDGPLIDLYARATRDYATSSLYPEIYRVLPNDTDLTLFIRDGFPSFNFAFVGNVAHYHTTLDTRAHLDPVTLQQHGNNMLGIARGLEKADFAQLHGRDDIYLDILGRVLLRTPKSWALPLSILAFLLLALAAWRAGPVAAADALRGLLITPALVLGATMIGFVLFELASLLSGTPDPSYAWPAALRIGLGLGIAAMAILVSPLATARTTAAAVWLWLALLGIVVAIFIPGFSPYFLIPSFFAGILLLATSFAATPANTTLATCAWLAAAMMAFLLWSSIGSSGESVMGLKLYPLFVIPFAVAATTLMPLLARYRLPRHQWLAATAIAFVAAIGAATVQGLEPAFSAATPQRLNITYVEVASKGRAYWALDAQAPVPKPMLAVAKFSKKPLRLAPRTPLVYVAPAGAPHFASPTATVHATAMAGGLRHVALALHGSDTADQMFLVIPKEAELSSIDINDWHIPAEPEWSGENTVVFACMSRDCARANLTLSLKSGAPITLGLYEQRFGAPAAARNLVNARPASAVPSQEGDGVTLIGAVQVPAG
jgi:hypothetical protein